MTTAETVSGVVDALGGNHPTASLLGVRASAVSNWRRTGYFPPRLSIELRRVAGARGIIIPDALFRAVPNSERQYANAG